MCCLPYSHVEVCLISTFDFFSLLDLFLFFVFKAFYPTFFAISSWPDDRRLFFSYVLLYAAADADTMVVSKGRRVVFFVDNLKVFVGDFQRNFIDFRQKICEKIEIITPIASNRLNYPQKNFAKCVKFPQTLSQSPQSRIELLPNQHFLSRCCNDQKTSRNLPFSLSCLKCHKCFFRLNPLH